MDAATNERLGRAVVLGGSMAGLLATRALADVFAEVLVVDRDELVGYDTHRRGVPQARHAHALLARGQLVLEELFPGLTGDLISRGVPTGDVLGDVRMHLSGHRLRRVRTGLVALSASRACLEQYVRARVCQLPGVTFAPPSDVVGLATTPDRRRVTGARVLRRADGSSEEIHDADLVIDATGRGSRAPVWLGALGIERPDEEHVRIDLCYTTRRFRLPLDALDGDVASLHAPTPDQPRGGVLARLEGDQWMLTLAGVLGDRPPSDPDGFLAFARSFAFPDIEEALRGAEPMDDPVAFRFPASVRRRYERLAHMPAGFLPVGDSACSFNPIYGQGMTVAALQALALRRHLNRFGLSRPARLRRSIARAADPAWRIATGADFAFPGVDGHQPLSARIASAYITRLHAAAEYDDKVATAFARVSGLVDRPEALLHPRIVARVLRAGTTRGRNDGDEE
jgi:flavin-dependent dehydrogenase